MSRKKWATSFPSIPGDERRRHSSKVAVYRYLNEQASQSDQLQEPIAIVWIDAGYELGWQVYERVDLREVQRG